MMVRPLLKRFVKFAIAATSVISTTCSSLKCSKSASRVSSPVGGLGQLARVQDGGALIRSEAVVLLGLQGAQLVFGDPGLFAAGDVRGRAECALVGIGARQVNQLLDAPVDGARAHDRAVERHEVLERLGTVRHRAKERAGLFGLGFEIGEKFVLRGFHHLDCCRHMEPV